MAIGGKDWNEENRAGRAPRLRAIEIPSSSAQTRVRGGDRRKNGGRDLKFNFMIVLVKQSRNFLYQLWTEVFRAEKTNCWIRRLMWHQPRVALKSRFTSGDLGFLKHQVWELDAVPLGILQFWLSMAPWDSSTCFQFELLRAFPYSLNLPF